MTPHLFFDIGAIINLKSILKEISPSSIFLVTGKKSYRLSGLQTFIEDHLDGYNFLQYSDFEKNPKIEDIETGINLFRLNKCDLTIAAGGGSVIDMAKAINFLQGQLLNPRSIIINGYSGKIKSTPPLIAIPTTAGSGSEATHFGVVYINNKKYSLAHPNILPNYIIIDPQLTYSLGKYQTSCTGMDAFCQAIESYWAVKANRKSRKYAKKALLLSYNNLAKAVNKPDIESRKKMCYAAYFSGKAINISKTTGPHAVAYAITAYLGIPHGHAVALTIRQFIDYNFKVTADDINDPNGINTVRNNLLDIVNILGCSSIEDLILNISSLLLSIELKTNLCDFNPYNIINIKNLIIDGVNAERINNNPRKLTKVVLNGIIESLFNESY
jgi:alcohol dehydrogenase